MGLMARDIAYRGRLPIFFYGQHYMGALEAYLAAAVFRLFGSSLFSLRVSLILLFALFLFSTYLLTSQLYSRAWALLTVTLLGLGSSFVLARELSAIGGYPETLLCGSLAFLLASRLALTYKPEVPQSKWRYAGYAGWGFIVGLGLWSDLLIAPFALCSALLLLVCCWRELRAIVAGICALLGLVTGSLPLLYYNLTAAPGQDSLSVLWQIQHSSNGYLVAHLGQQIFGTIQISIPMMTGSPFCPVPERLEPGVLSSLSCTLLRAGWGMGYLLLFTLALALAMRTLLQAHSIIRGCRWLISTLLRSTQSGQPQRTLTPTDGVVAQGNVAAQVENAKQSEERQAFALAGAQLLLLASALITLLLYAKGTSPVEWPGSRARYLIGLLVAAPAVLWPLWHGMAGTASTTGSEVLENRKYLFKRGCGRRLRAGLLLTIAALLCWGTVGTFQELPATRRANQRQQALIEHLVSIGATHIYSDYWTCNRVAFVSNERVICGVVEQDLQRSTNFNRDAAYYPIVSADPRAAYVFSIYTPISPQAQHTKLAPDKYSRSTFEQYIIYQPLSR
ncbi:MAG: hypothetical protein PVS3B1_19820 [Ktedonobacteraceae bacterium]